jgi:hypothetical protein
MAALTIITLSCVFIFEDVNEAARLFDLYYLFFYGATAPGGPAPRVCRGVEITRRHAEFVKTLLDE